MAMFKSIIYNKVWNLEFKDEDKILRQAQNDIR